MAMTTERRAYVNNQITRLAKKLDRINGAYSARSHSGHPEDVKTRELLLKDRSSTHAAIELWIKELKESGQ